MSAGAPTLAPMSADPLFPDLPRPLRRYTVTVIVQRDDADAALVPPGGHAVLELAAAAVAAAGVQSVWTCSQTVLSMLLDAESKGAALDAGVAVARVLGGGDGAVTVTAEPVRVPVRA